MGDSVKEPLTGVAKIRSENDGSVLKFTTPQTGTRCLQTRFVMERVGGWNGFAVDREFATLARTALGPA
jgi:hypothetical protein